MSSLNLIILAIVVFLNLRAYWMMWKDKNLARAGQYRIPEATLLLNALFFGAAGVVLASFPPVRHKGRKIGFMIQAYFYLALNVVVLGWWFARSASV